MKTTKTIIFFLSLFLAFSIKAHEFDGVPTISRSMEQAKVTIWLEEEAKKGHVEAQFLLGERLVRFAESNMEQAKFWWKRAANQGHIEAQFGMGAILFEGNYSPLT